MTKTANQELFDALLRHQIFMLRYSGFVRNRITELLNATEYDIASKIRGSTLKSKGLTTPIEVLRMKALQRSIVAIRNSGWNKANELLYSEMKDLAVSEPAAYQAVLKTTSPVAMTTVMPAPSTLRAIAFSTPFEGRTLKKMAKNMQEADIRRITNAVRVGMVEGETMNRIAQRIVGTGSLRGADGVTQVTRRQVQAVTRTAVQHVANQVRREYLRENADVVLKERYVATLDSRTTPICASLDGQLFKRTEGPTPPLHFNCRSIRIAAFDSSLAAERPAKPTTERMLVKEYAKKNSLGNVRSRADLPYGSKGGFDAYSKTRIRQLTGPVPGDTTYNTWLRTQPIGFQNEVLGVTKSKLYRDGGLPLSKFVDRNGNELPLKLLARKHAAAFRAAGLTPDEYF